MDSSPANLPDRPTLAQALAEERDAALEQLAAAWQLQTSRIEEALHAGWRDSLERIVEERFADLAARLDTNFQNEVAARMEAEVQRSRWEAHLQAREQTTETFLRALRRLLHHNSPESWASSLLESAAGLCGRAAVFSVEDQTLRCLRSRGYDEPAAERLAAIEIPLASSPAFVRAVSSEEAAPAVRVSEELSERVAALLGGADGAKIRLFPITRQETVTAVLCAEDVEWAPVDASALDLLAAMTGAVLAAAPAQVAAPERSPDTEQRPSFASPEWPRLSREEQEQHLRARRFARVQVAEMRLYKAQAVKSGRVDRNLYGTLTAEIDAGRAAFHQQFLSDSPSPMVDYFHLELVHTLAQDDASALGPDYPGPLV